MSYKKFEDLTTYGVVKEFPLHKLYGYLIHDYTISSTVILVKKSDYILLSDFKNLMDIINKIKTEMIETYLFGNIHVNIHLNMDEIIQIQDLLVLLEDIVPINTNRISVMSYYKMKPNFSLNKIKKLQEIINSHFDKKNKNILKMLNELIKLSSDKTKITFIFKDFNKDNNDIILEPIIIRSSSIFEKINNKLFGCFKTNKITSLQFISEKSNQTEIENKRKIPKFDPINTKKHNFL